MKKVIGFLIYLLFFCFAVGIPSGQFRFAKIKVIQRTGLNYCIVSKNRYF